MLFFLCRGKSCFSCKWLPMGYISGLIALVGKRFIQNYIFQKNEFSNIVIEAGETTEDTSAASVPGEA